MKIRDRPGADARGKLYLVVEIAIVLALSAILVKAVAPATVFDTVWGRLYPPARTLAMLGFVGWLLSLTGQNWRDMGFRRPRSWPKTIGLGVGTFVVSVVANQLLRHAMIGLGLSPGGDIHLFARVQGNLLEYLYFAIPIAVFVAGFGEELIGRGYLISRIAAILGDGKSSLVLALLLSSALFGMAHAYQGASGVIQTGTTGFIFGAAYLLAGRNIWPAIIAHSISDVTGFTILFLGGAKLIGS